jgi:hypothetical protein
VKLLQLTSAKGAALWVSAGQITYFGASESTESSLYGSNNTKAGTRLFLAGGGHVDVRESAGDIVAQFGD